MSTPYLHPCPDSAMTSRTNRHLLVLGCALVTSALLQACAVTTGAFAPSRSAVTNRNMTSHYDVLRQQSPTGGRRSMASTRDGGLFDFRYY